MRQTNLVPPHRVFQRKRPTILAWQSNARTANSAYRTTNSQAARVASVRRWIPSAPADRFAAPTGGTTRARVTLTVRRVCRPGASRSSTEDLAVRTTPIGFSAYLNVRSPTSAVNVGQKRRFKRKIIDPLQRLFERNSVPVTFSRISYCSRVVITSILNRRNDDTCIHLLRTTNVTRQRLLVKIT